jgi:hypothetical protein
MKWSISDLRGGKIAVKYAGDFRKLSRVLKEAFPEEGPLQEIIVFNSKENYFTGHTFNGLTHFYVQTPIEPDVPKFTEHELYKLFET